EAMIKKTGLSALADVLELQRQLIEQFWDTLYPEIEDGDAEMRAMPVEWLATQMPRLLRELPLTKKGLSSLQYTQSRAVGYEADATGEKAEARAAAIAEGKISAEEFDAQLDQTPLAFYETLAAQIEAAQEAMRSLETVCDDKFGNAAPNLSPMRGALE